MNMNGERVLRKSTVEKTQNAKERRKFIGQKRKRKISTSDEIKLITVPEKKLKVDSDVDNKEITNYYHAKFRRILSPKTNSKDKEAVETSTTTLNNSESIKVPQEVQDSFAHSNMDRDSGPTNSAVISSSDIIICTPWNVKKSPSVLLLTPKDNRRNDVDDISVESLKRSLRSQSPSPLVIGNLVGVSTLHNIINDQDFLEFLEALARCESDAQDSPVENGPCIQRLEEMPVSDTNLSNYFECPCCCKVFADRTMARMHLENYCSKLSS